MCRTHAGVAMKDSNTNSQPNDLTFGTVFPGPNAHLPRPSALSDVKAALTYECPKLSALWYHRAGIYMFSPHVSRGRTSSVKVPTDCATNPLSNKITLCTNCPGTNIFPTRSFALCCALGA